MLYDAVLEIENNHQDHGHKSSIIQVWRKLIEDAQVVAARIEALVQTRLHYPEAK